MNQFDKPKNLNADLAPILFKLNKIFKKFELNAGKLDADELNLIFDLLNRDKHVLVEYKLNKIFNKLNELQHRKLINVNFDDVKNKDFKIRAKICVLGLTNYEINDESRSEIQDIVNSYQNNSLNRIILLKKIVKSNDFRVFMSLINANLLDTIINIDLPNDKSYYQKYFTWKYLKFLCLLFKNMSIALKNGDFKCSNLNLAGYLKKTLDTILLNHDNEQQLHFELISKYVVIFLQVQNILFLNGKLNSNVFETNFELLKCTLPISLESFNFLFQCEDSTIIEYLYECLKLNNNLAIINIASQSVLESRLDTNYLFFKLLISIKFDCQVFIEWLISNETNFLEYFLFYLKFGLKFNENSEKFSLKFDCFLKDLLLFCEFISFNIEEPEAKSNTKDYFINKYIKFLEDMNIKLDRLKNVFPYNCKPLLNLLKANLSVFSKQ